MKVCLIGMGYVGLVTGVCLAEHGHTVYGVEIDRGKLSLLQQGIPTIHEDNLEEMLKRNLQEGRLIFTDSLSNGVAPAEIVFICVGTPPAADGSADLSNVINVAKSIGKVLNDYKIIVTKSTVPIGTNELVAKEIRANMPEGLDFAVAANPEFLREGKAVYDTLHPDRIVIGAESPEVAERLNQVYAKIEAPRILTTLRNAELIKYASNSFLATKISYINSIARLCDSYGADVEIIAKGMGLDPRIGPQFLRAGLGYGGSCLPKDIDALIMMAREVGLEPLLLQAVKEVNDQQQQYFFEKIQQHYGSLQDKTLALLGLAFKGGTDDIRFSPAITLVQKLLEAGAIVRAYDPYAMQNTKNILGKSITYGTSPYKIVKGADGLIIATDWEEFSHLEYKKIGKLLKEPTIFDGRNLFTSSTFDELGITYYNIGHN